jgi:hypothetical protein
MIMITDHDRWMITDVWQTTGELLGQLTRNGAIQPVNSTERLGYTVSALAAVLANENPPLWPKSESGRLAYFGECILFAKQLADNHDNAQKVIVADDHEVS